MDSASSHVRPSTVGPNPNIWGPLKCVIIMWLEVVERLYEMKMRWFSNQHWLTVFGSDPFNNLVHKIRMRVFHLNNLMYFTNISNIITFMPSLLRCWCHNHCSLGLDHERPMVLLLLDDQSMLDSSRPTLLSYSTSQDFQSSFIWVLRPWFWNSEGEIQFYQSPLI